MSSPIRPEPNPEKLMGLLRQLAQLTGANNTQSQPGLQGSGRQQSAAFHDVMQKQDSIAGEMSRSPNDERLSIWQEQYNDLNDKATLMDDLRTQAESNLPAGSGRFYGRLSDPGQTADGGWPRETGQRGEDEYGGTAEPGFKRNRLADLRAMMEKLKRVGR